MFIKSRLVWLSVTGFYRRTGRIMIFLCPADTLGPTRPTCT